jgi:type I restriction enzyme S subunit
MENKTLFGELPLGWKHVALSDVTTFISRGRQPKYIASVEGIPVINQKMIRNLTIDYRYVKYNDAKKNINKSVFIKIGDTLVNSTGVGTVGRSAYISIDPMRPTFVDSHVTIVRPDTAIVDPKFMSVVLSSDVYSNYMGSTLAQGSTGQVELSRQKLSEMCIPFPPLNTQHLIGTIFDLIDQKIKLNHQINKNLLRLAKQQFNLTFPNVHEGNSRLSNVMENFDRKRIPLARREREKRQGVYRYVGATSVLDYVDDYLFDGTYLLMGEDGTVQDEKGFPILQYIWGKFWPNNHTHVLSGTFVSTEWLYLFLMNTNVRSRITGAVQQKISQANMNSIPLTIPSKDELFRFQKQIEPVFSQIQLLDEQNLKLTAIHKLLLPKLLAGQIDLSNLEGAIQNA